MHDRYSTGDATNPAPERSEPDRSIGSRELKTRLGTYLRLVREGATLVITDRGHPVAELRPYSTRSGDLANHLRELTRLGVIGQEVAEHLPLDDFEPVEGRGAPASAAILEDREDRF